MFEKPINILSLHTLIAALLFSSFAETQLQAATVNVRIMGPSSSYASHDAAAIATELNNMLAGATGYSGSTASATVLSGQSLTEAYYHPSYRAATRAALAESYTHLVILPETFWLVSYPEMTFDGVYQMSRKALALGSTPLLMMPGTGSAGNVTTLGTNAYRIGNGCGIHIVPGGYAAQSASLLDPSTGTNQARQAYLLAATIFTKITGLNATTGSTYVPAVSNPSSLATTAVNTINTHNSTVHYSTSRENSGLVRYRTFTPATNSVRYAKTGTSTEQGISTALTPILQASGYTVNLYSISSTWGWTDAMATGAATNFATYPNEYILAYVRSPFVSAQSTTMTSPNQANLLPIAYDQQYTSMSTNNTLDDIYWLSEDARAQCATYGFATVPIHLGAARLNDVDPSLAFSNDGTHWNPPFYNMIAAMMATTSLGRLPTPTSAILADSNLLNGFNVGKQLVRQLAFLSETEAYTPDTALAITAVPALQAVQNQAFNYSFTATGGTAPYTWTEESGLPAGLTLSPSGSLSGIATAGAGTWNLILQVKDSNGAIRKVCTTLTVVLTGSGPGTLSMASGDGLSATGSFGGPFSPSSVQYTLSNVGTTSINWTATKTQSWVTLSAASGTLAAGANTTVTVSLNTAANSLASNNYSDTVTFTNTTNANGNTTRSVALTVFAAAANLTWDANGSTSTQTDGAGEWTTASQWWNGSTNVTWAAGSNALFGNGGTGGAVTLAAPRTAYALTFNSFSGTYTLGTTGQALTLNGGITVNAAAGSVTLASPVTLGGAQAWTNNSTNPLTASNAISGSGNLTKAGTGTVVLAPNPDSSNYTGATVVSNGVLNIQKPTALGSLASGTSVSAGGALQIQGGISIGAEPLTLEGSGISNTGALRNISGTNLYDGLVSLTGATVINSDAGSLVLTNAGTITGAGAALTLGGAGSTTIFGIIGTTTGSLTKEGAGTLTLSGANTYSGGTVINAGNITLGTTATDSLGAVNGNVTVNASTTLTLNGATTLEKSFTLNNNVLLNFANASGGVTITGAVSGNGGIRPIGGGTALAQRITTLSSTANDFNGPISNPVGANFADLVVNSLYDGVGAGNITFGEASQSRTMRLQWGAGATGPLSLSTRQIAIVGTTPTANLSNSNATYPVTITSNLLNSNTGAATFELGGTNSGSNRFGGNITNGSGGGTLALTKSGAGTWALSGTNSYSGTTINAFSNPAGVLIFQGMQALPSSTTLQQTFSGGTGGFAPIRLLDDSATPLARSGVNITLLGTGSSGMTLFVGNNSTSNGGTSASTQTGSTITLGNLNITQSSTGNTSQTLAVTGANGYRLQINNVTPTLQAAATTWTATLTPTTAPLTVVGTVQQAGNGSAGVMTLNLNGTTSANLMSGIVSDSADAIPKALSLTKSNTSAWTLTGVNTYTGLTTISGGTLELGDGTSGKDGTIENTSGITNNATLIFNRFGNVSSNLAISGTGAVTKTGPGAQTLTGTVSYAGITTVSNGKLFIDGSLSNVAIGLTVNNGATLGGTGTIGRNVTIAAGGKLEFNLSTPSASHDRLDISTGRSFGFAGASELTITSSGGTEPGTYTLLTGGNNLTGVAPAVVNLPAGWVATVSISGNSLLLNVTTVPGASAGTLTLNPAGGLSASGSIGGPFSPTSNVYTLTNPGASAVNWTASKTAGWVTLSATTGTLAAGANTSVTVSLNGAANSLAVGSYNDVVTFSDTTNGGSTTRTVALTVSPSPYTISYAGNGNNGGTVPSNQLKTHDVDLTLSGQGTLVRSGFSFVGWNTVAGGTGTAYAAGATYTVNAVLSLSAQWNANPTVTAGNDQLVSLSGTSFTPADAGALAWYDASDSASITQVSGAVSQWADKIGTNHMVQATSASQPLSGSAPNQINSLNTIAFDGTADFLKTASNPFGASISNAMFIGVFNIGTLSNSTMFSLSGSSTNRWQSHAPYGDGTLYFDAGGAAAPNRISGASGWAANQNKLLGFYCSTTASVQQVWVNGTNTLSDATGHTVNTGGGIALGYDGSTSYDNCRMGEVVVINGAVSATNREKLEGYLAHKWGLAGSLPAAHPYKSQSPSNISAVANLTGTANDPNGDPLTLLWTKVSGPGAVVFGNANAVNTTATFTVAGTYTLRLMASDLGASPSDDIVVTVNPSGGTVDHFTISSITGSQTVGTPISGITLTAKDASNNTVTGFTGAVAFGGTGGFTGISTAFIAGILTTVSVTPTVAGSNLTFIVNDGANHIGSSTITTIQTQFSTWSGATAFDADTNGDGVQDGLAFILGAATPSASTAGLLPAVNQSAGNLLMTFKCLNAATRGTAVLELQYSKDLGVADLWTDHTAAVPESNATVNNVTFVISAFDANLNNVQVTIPSSEASPGLKLFSRLKATSTP